jgi:hypothetical protein
MFLLTAALYNAPRPSPAVSTVRWGLSGALAASLTSGTRRCDSLISVTAARQFYNLYGRYVLHKAQCSNSSRFKSEAAKNSMVKNVTAIPQRAHAPVRVQRQFKGRGRWPNPNQTALFWCQHLYLVSSQRDRLPI